MDQQRFLQQLQIILDRENPFPLLFSDLTDN